MSATKNASEEGIELQSQPKPATVQAPVAEDGGNNLIEIDEPVGVEKAGSAPDGMSPLTAAPEPKEASVAAPVARKKKYGLFSGFNREKRDAVIKGVMIAAIFILGAATIGLGVKVGMDGHAIQDLQSSVNHSVVAHVEHMAAVATGIEIRGTYLEGMSGVLDGGFNLELAEHAADTASVTSGACDDVMETFPVFSAMVNLTTTTTATLLNGTASSTASFVTANGGMRTLSAIDLTGVATQSFPVVTHFLTSSVSMIETSMPTSTSNASTHGISSSSSSTSSISHTCAEWGDGAGPCTRPYGRPNSTPASVLSFEPAFGGVKTATYTPPVMESVSSVAHTSSIPNATVLAGPMSGTDDCGPTATVYVTLTAANNPTAASTGSTVYGTSTQVSFVTLTISGIDGGPLTTTETVFWSNKSAATATQVMASINGTLTTLSLANSTVTMPHTAPKHTVTTTTVVQSPMSSGGALASGSERSIPKPLTASSSGSSGVYCAVMLMALLALLA